MQLLSFVGGWSKWAVAVVCAHFVLLFVGARDGGSLFFMCGRARFLSLFVGGWSERSLSLVGFHGLWVVSFVGGQGFVLMVGGSCRLWAVMPVLCGGWSWFMGYWGGHPMSLVGQLWLFVGGHTHLVSWWVCSSSFMDFDRGEVVVVRGRSCPFCGMVGDCHWWVVGAMWLSHTWFQNPRD